MRPEDIDDRDLTPSDPADPASLQHVNATVCPECHGAGVTEDGSPCPVCQGAGVPTGRTGGG